ncbi:MAG: hypothetical protein WC321_00505 [Candidatus Omnitrophota bacterium]|jgi:hypothetical protein
MRRVILASVIGLLGVTGILAFSSNQAFLNISNRNLLIATNHADYLLKNLKQLPLDTVLSEVRQGAWNWSPKDLVAKGIIPLAGESIETQVNGTNPIRVTVITRWNESGRKNRNVVLNTLLTKH